MYFFKIFVLIFLIFITCGQLIAQAQGKDVTFQLKGFDTARSVTVAGTFNNWDKTKDSLIYDSRDKFWKLQISIPFGSYEYRFLINGNEYIKDPANPYFGGEYSNSLLFVDPPSKPSFRIINPLPGEMINKFPLQIKVKITPGSETNKIDKKKTEIEIDGKNIDFKYNKRERTLFTVVDSLPEGIHFLYVSLVDKKGNSARPDSFIFVVNKNNLPPVAEAGYTQFVFPGDSIQLNGGLSSDPDDDNLEAVQWQQSDNDGQKVILQEDKTLFPKASIPDTGKYYFVLKINDGKQWSEPDTTEVISLNLQRDSIKFTFHEADFPGVEINKVAVVGDFNGWEKNRNFLEKRGSGGQWQLTLPVRRGMYEYKFVINDTLWTVDPQNPRRLSDGVGGENSLASVATNENIYPSIDFQLQDGEIVFTHKLPPGKYNIRYYQDINNPGRIVNQPFSDGFFSYLDARPGAYFYYPVADSNETAISKQNILINNEGFHQVQFLDFSASPNWARDAIIYLLYVRKFSGEGTINGVIEQLDYLKSLGVSCLWLMPVMESSTPNGYAPTDFFSIEKDYGTLQDYQHLIQELHKRDMRIIFDFIANHTSNQHPLFMSSWRNPNSLFRDWYVWKSDKEYAFHNTWDQLPNLNYNNPNVRNYILKVAKFWIDQGIDGLRCDVAWAVPHNFWKDFRRRVKAWNPQLLLIDEVLPGEPAYHDEEFDMSYDTDFYGGLLDYFKGKLPLPGLIFRIKKHHLNYPPQAQALRYLDTQDLPRFLKQFGKEKTRLAAALLFTLPGTPLIYYGQEIGLSEQRPQMKFNRQQNEYFRFYKKLIGLRRDNPELRSQSIEFLKNSSPTKVLTFLREKSGKEILVVINMTGNAVSLSLKNREYISSNLLFSHPRKRKEILEWPLSLKPYEIQIWR